MLIAQGSEAGGYGGTISTMALVPQVVVRRHGAVPFVAGDALEAQPGQVRPVAVEYTVREAMVLLSEKR